MVYWFIWPLKQPMSPSLSPLSRLHLSFGAPPPILRNTALEEPITWVLSGFPQYYPKPITDKRKVWTEWNNQTTESGPLQWIVGPGNGKRDGTPCCRWGRGGGSCSMNLSERGCCCWPYWTFSHHHGLLPLLGPPFLPPATTPLHRVERWILPGWNLWWAKKKYEQHLNPMIHPSNDFLQRRQKCSNQISCPFVCCLFSSH